MSTYVAVCTQLKSQFKIRGWLYADVAPRVGLSESGLKKVLNAEDGSFDRIDSLCALLGLSLTDVLAAANQAPPPLVFTAEAEEAFIDKPALWFFLTELVMHHFDVQRVAASHGLTVEQVRPWSDRLAALGLVRVSHEGRVTSLLPAHTGVQLSKRLGELAAWPLQTGLIEHIRARMRSEGRAFDGLDLLSLSQLEVREETAMDLRQGLLALTREAAVRAKREAMYTPARELVRVGLLIGMAPFEVSDAVRLRPS